MSPIRILILVLAAAAAIGAAVLMRNMSNQPAPAPQPVPQQVAEAPETQPMPELRGPEVVRVLVASRDLVRGQMLAPADMAWQDWPADAVNPSFYTDALAPDAMNDLAGAAVRSEIYANEPMLPNRLVEKGETGYMAALLRPGMRAVSVQVSPETGAGGFIIPDDRVDVIVTFEVEYLGGRPGGDETRSEIILENVRVLAVDEVFRQTQTGPHKLSSVATLELRPEDSETLATAERMGNISLALRSFADAEKDGELPINTAETFESLANPIGGASNAMTLVRNGRTSTVLLGESN